MTQNNEEMPKNKLEGFIGIDEEQVCNYTDCKDKATMSTIFKDKMKGINVEKIHFWCDKHYNVIAEGDTKDEKMQ